MKEKGGLKKGRLEVINEKLESLIASIEDYNDLMGIENDTYLDTLKEMKDYYSMINMLGYWLWKSIQSNETVTLSTI